MPEQYVATDKRTGLEVAVTGEFPPHSDDRIRIARTTTLFTRLMATMLANESESERREQFQAIETQLEVAEALIRQDLEEVRRLMQQTLERMGISAEDLDEMVRKLIQEFGSSENLPPEIRRYAEERGMLGDSASQGPSTPPAIPLDDVGLYDEPRAGDESSVVEDVADADQPADEQPNGSGDGERPHEPPDDGPIPMGPASG